MEHSADRGSGSADRLPGALLHVSLACTLFATILSLWSIVLHLKAYRKPALQRLVVRIILMIPLYAIASLVSLHSLEAAFWIDAVRDLYEAFVIYTFFSLLVTYLGGERSLLILLHGRPLTPHPWPVSIFIRGMDGSDPYTFLGLKRGILQYVYVKPALALVTLILKMTNTYSDGKLGWTTGYTYVSAVYNASICLSLYCLAMFWLAIHEDVRPFHPTPKFLCVKGILFFSFWQSIFVSVLVAGKVIKHVGPYTDAEHMSLALGDLLMCFEMPLFAIAHTYAFCRSSDYVDPNIQYVARLPFTLALRDCCGMLDVWKDFQSTTHGRGMSYRSYEPAEGGVHASGKARERRIRAGLRYEGGGKGGKKYWLPRTEGGVLGGIGRDYGSLGATASGIPPLPRVETGITQYGHGPHSRGYKSPPPLNPASDDYFPSHRRSSPLEYESDDDDESVSSLEFSPIQTPSTSGRTSPSDNDERLYEEARGYLHGDWAYRVIDVSKEEARRKMWDEEQNVLKGYGRLGQGRVRGERWGRGVQEVVDIAFGGKKKLSEGRKVYGAWGGGDDDARSISHLYPVIEPNSTHPRADASSRGPNPTSPSLGIYNGDDERPEAYRSNSSSRHPASPSEDDLRLHWTQKGKGKAKEAIKAVAAHLKPQTALVPDERHLDVAQSHDLPPHQPVSPGKPNSSDLPPDAIDLVVEDDKARERELERKRRKGEPARRSLDRDIFYRKAELVDGVIRHVGDETIHDEEAEEAEEEEEELTKATTRVPLLHISPPQSLSATERLPRLIAEHKPTSSPWFEKAAKGAGSEESHNPWI